MVTMYYYHIETQQQPKERKMTNLIGKRFHPVSVFTDIVDVWTQVSVVEQNEKAVRFDDGKSARIVHGEVIGFAPVDETPAETLANVAEFQQVDGHEQYFVVLEDDTTGEINTDTLDGQHPSAFIGEVVKIHSHDENGNPVEFVGVLKDVM